MTAQNIQELREARKAIYYARNSTASSETYRQLSEVIRALEPAMDRAESEASK